MIEIKMIDEWLDTAQLICTKTDRKAKYDFNKFTFLSKFTIYHRDLTLQEAGDDQKELQILINKLNNGCNPKTQTKIKEKNDAFKPAKKNAFYQGRYY